MLTFAHFRFQKFLKFKASEYGKVVMNVNEVYISKTCSWNGVIKDIGNAKFIKDGKIVVDRDYNGARGIFLRALRDSAFSLTA
jgi:putative transposase